VGDLLQDEVHAGRFPALGAQVHRALAVIAAVIAWIITAIGLWAASYHGLTPGGAG
jgi:hypothetical protein